MNRDDIVKTIFTCAYTAIAAYFALMYIFGGNEMCLIVALWAGAMLEIRSRHYIEIHMHSKEEED